MLQCSLSLRNTRFSPDITQDGLGGPVTLVEFFHLITDIPERHGMFGVGVAAFIPLTGYKNQSRICSLITPLTLRKFLCERVYVQINEVQDIAFHSMALNI